MSIHSQAACSSIYSIGELRVATGETDGISLDGQFLHISETLCSDLRCNEVKNILVTYKLIGRYGSEIPKTALFLLSNTHNGPVISSPMNDQSFMQNGGVHFDLVPRETADASY